MMPTYTTNDGEVGLRDVWYFWNHCLTNKLHPRRKSQALRVSNQNTFHYCHNCGKRMVGGTLLCLSCYRKTSEDRLEIERLERRKDMMGCADEYGDLLKRCAKRGTCDILAVHKQYLGDDPDRLSTEFLVKLICGKDYSGGGREVLDLKQRGRKRK